MCEQAKTTLWLITQNENNAEVAYIRSHALMHIQKLNPFPLSDVASAADDIWNNCGNSKNLVLLMPQWFTSVH